MAYAVFTQNPNSIYEDLPGLRYNFPSAYLNMVRETVGDWVVFYESKQGAFGYVSVQKVVEVVADPKREDWFFAELDPGTLLQFETLVRRTDERGQTYERRLMGANGKPYSGGLNTSAVRRITVEEFVAILEAGMTEAFGPDALPRHPAAGFAEAQAPFGAAPLASDRVRLLSDRAYRDAAFARMVKAAYGGVCAISGLNLRNGGGRAEVQAAHIRPVADIGPDIVPNGLALSGTLHWMFDRGLISVAEDNSILVSHNKVDLATVERLVHPSRKLILPKARRDHPHPDYLRYHREEIFGRAA